MKKTDFTLWRIWVTMIVSFIGGGIVFKYLPENYFWIGCFVLMLLSLLYVTLFIEKHPKQELPFTWVYDETDHEWYKDYPQGDNE